MVKLIRSHLKGLALLCAILAPLSMLLEVLMDLQQPTLMSDIVDIGVASGDLSYVLHTGGRMILFALIGLVGGAGCSILATYASVHMADTVRTSLFKKIFTLSAAEVDVLETSSLVTRMTSDVTQVQEMVPILLRSLSRAPMLFLGGIVMSFILSPQLALILCAALPILTIATVLIVTKAIPMFTQVQRRMDRVNTIMRENLLGIRVVKAFTLEDRQTNHFGQANHALANDNIRAQRVTFLLIPIATLVMNLSVVAVLWFGGLMEMAGSLPLGKILAFVNYLLQITNALLMLVNSVVSISRAQSSSLRIQEVLDAQPSITPAAQPQAPHGGDIVFDHVSFGYSSSERALKDINLHIPQGQKVGIIGATGCGKSTLAALITRQYDPNAGTVSIGGVDLRCIPADVLRQKVNIVLQNSLLFSGTVAENLRYGDEQADTKALWAALETAEADGFIRALPKQLAGEVAQRGTNFSGGQKQRLSLARSLLKKPDILILDDSTSAVDLITEARIYQGISETMQGTTLLIIAQRISSIMDCDTIFVLDKGRVVAQGNHAQLMTDSDIYRSIATSQLGEEAMRCA